MKEGTVRKPDDGRTTLTPRKVLRIRVQAESGCPLGELAEKYRVANSTVRSVVRGRTWRDVGGHIEGKDYPRMRRRRRGKLSEEDVRQMRQLYKEGHSMSALAERFGVTDASISYAVRGKTWKHVPGATLQRFLRAGEQMGSSKLTEDAVREIRRRMSEGAYPSDLSMEYGVSPTTVVSAAKRKTWKHVR